MACAGEALKCVWGGIGGERAVGGSMGEGSKWGRKEAAYALCNACCSGSAEAVRWLAQVRRS